MVQYMLDQQISGGARNLYVTLQFFNIDPDNPAIEESSKGCQPKHVFEI